MYTVVRSDAEPCYQPSRTLLCTYTQERELPLSTFCGQSGKRFQIGEILKKN